MNLTMEPPPTGPFIAADRDRKFWIGFYNGLPIWETMSDGPSTDDAAATRAKLDAYVARQTKKAA